MQFEKIGVIVNPVSGTTDKKKVVELIQKKVEGAELTIVYTERPNHATELAEEFVKKHYPLVAVVGGDGTVNEVGRALIHSKTALAIIPSGSGNGLGRHLKIPVKYQDAIDLLNNGNIKTIDFGLMQGNPFFCTAGVGFDAKVGKKFAKHKGRGFLTYVRAVIEMYLSYESKKYKLEIDGKKYKARAFLITVANASQYGNNAYIAPDAEIDDGLLDVCILSPFPRKKVLDISIKLFKRRIDTSPYLEIIRGKHIVLQRKKKGAVHYDGEPSKMGKKINFEVKAKGLRILTP